MSAITRLGTDVYLAYGRPAAIAMTELGATGDLVQVIDNEGRIGLACLLDEDIAPRKLYMSDLVWITSRDLTFTGRQVNGTSARPTWEETIEGLDPLAREIALLHAPVKNTYDRNTTCRGCDMDGHDAESPEWPCRTADLVLQSVDMAGTDIEPTLR